MLKLIYLNETIVPVDEDCTSWFLKLENMASYANDALSGISTNTTPQRSLFVTFPNVRVAKSNATGVYEGTVVDIVLYDQFFAVCPSYSHNNNTVGKKFGCPRTITTLDMEDILEVQLWEGFLLAFKVEQKCLAWLCDEFKQLQM